jgi:hypothetical protein
LCETTGNFTTLGVFVEGTTFNIEYTLPFKKGAFIGNHTVIPGYFHYDCSGIHVAHDTKHNVFVILLQYCAFDIKAYLTELPLFIPNDYMYETYKDKGKEKWEIYAWAIRDILTKASGKP